LRILATWLCAVVDAREAVVGLDRDWRLDGARNPHESGAQGRDAGGADRAQAATVQVRAQAAKQELEAANQGKRCHHKLDLAKQLGTDGHGRRHCAGPMLMTHTRPSPARLH